MRSSTDKEAWSEGDSSISQNFLRMSSDEVTDVWKVVMWILACAEVEVDPVLPQSTQPNSVSKAVGDPVGPFRRP